MRAVARLLGLAADAMRTLDNTFKAMSLKDLEAGWPWRPFTKRGFGGGGPPEVPGKEVPIAAGPRCSVPHRSRSRDPRFSWGATVRGREVICHMDQLNSS